MHLQCRRGVGELLYFYYKLHEGIEVKQRGQNDSVKIKSLEALGSIFGGGRHRWVSPTQMVMVMKF